MSFLFVLIGYGPAIEFRYKQRIPIIAPVELVGKVQYALYQSQTASRAQFLPVIVYDMDRDVALL